MKYKYIEGTQLVSNGVRGVVVKNYKLPGDICVQWENGTTSSYSEEWLNENTEEYDPTPDDYATGAGC